MPHLFIFHFTSSHQQQTRWWNAEPNHQVCGREIDQARYIFTASFHQEFGRKFWIWEKSIVAWGDKAGRIYGATFENQFFLSYTGDLDLSYSILSHLTKVPRFSTISMFLTSAEKKGKPRFVHVHVSLLYDRLL